MTSVEAITATLEALRVGEEMPMTNEALAAYRERIAAVLAEQFGEWERCESCGGSGYEHHLTRNPAPDTSACGGCGGSGFVRAGRYGEGET